jgi:hypothetical protein
LSYNIGKKLLKIGFDYIFFSFPKLCPAVALSHQDGHHSADVLLLKAALIQVSDYRLLGASGLYFT